MEILSHKRTIAANMSPDIVAIVKKRLCVPLIVLAAGLAILPDSSFGQVSIAMPGGEIVFDKLIFPVVNEALGYSYPILRFKMLNRTGQEWPFALLKFDIEGTCRGESRKWTTSITETIAVPTRLDNL